MLIVRVICTDAGGSMMPFCIHTHVSVMKSKKALPQYACPWEVAFVNSIVQSNLQAFCAGIMIAWMLHQINATSHLTE